MKLPVFGLLLVISSTTFAESYDYSVPYCAALNDPNAYQSASAKEAKRLYQNADNWLLRFTDLKHDLTIDQDAFNALSILANTLSARGTTLVLAPIPSRGLVYPNQAPAEAEYDFTASKAEYTRYVKSLRSSGLSVVDFTEMLASKVPNLFLKRDFHWSELGAKESARIIAEHVKQLPLYGELEKSEFETTYSGISPSSDALENTFESICGYTFPRQFRRTFATQKLGDDDLGLTDNGDSDSDTADLLFSDTDDTPEAILLGTSFSSESRFNFNGFLSESLSVDVSNAAVSGGNAYGSPYQYFNSAEYKDNPPKLIIWEIPVHYTALIRDDMYSLLLPSVQNASCTAQNTIQKSTKKLTAGVNTALFNGGTDFEYLQQRDLIYLVEFENEGIFSFDTTLHFIERRQLRNKVIKSSRLPNDGKFVLDFNYFKEINDLHLMAIDIEVNEAEQSYGTVTTTICKKA